MSHPIELTSANFQEEVLNSPVPVLVDFWAPWCGPCRMMIPVLDELASELVGKIKVAKLNIDDPAHEALAVRYGIQSIPDMKVFKNGQVALDLVGARPKAMLLNDLAEVLK